MHKVSIRTARKEITRNYRKVSNFWTALKWQKNVQIKWRGLLLSHPKQMTEKPLNTTSVARAYLQTVLKKP